MKLDHEASTRAEPEPSDHVAEQFILNLEQSGNIGFSFNQSGGITAGTVNISAAPQPKLHARQVFVNQPVDGEYHTQVELLVESHFPLANLHVVAKAPSVRRIRLSPPPAGFVSLAYGNGPGFAAADLQRPYGRISLDVFTGNPENIRIEWEFQ